MLPVRVTRWDRATARSGMLGAPLAGLVVGLLAAALGSLSLLAGAGPLLAAVASVSVPAALTRGCIWTAWRTRRTASAAGNRPRTRCGS